MDKNIELININEENIHELSKFIIKLAEGNKIVSVVLDKGQIIIKDANAKKI